MRGKGQVEVGGGPKFTSGSEVNVRNFLVRVGGGGAVDSVVGANN